MKGYQRPLGIAPSRDCVSELQLFDALVDGDEVNANEQHRGSGYDDPRRLETIRLAENFGGPGFIVTRRP